MAKKKPKGKWRDLDKKGRTDILERLIDWACESKHFANRDVLFERTDKTDWADGLAVLAATGLV